MFQSFGDQLLRGRQLSSGEQRRPRLWRKYTFMTRLNFSTFTEKLPRRSFCDFKVILNNFSIWQLQRKIKRRRNVPQTASSLKIKLRKIIKLIFLIFPKCCDVNLMFSAAVTSPESVGACVCAAVAAVAVCVTSAVPVSVSTRYLHNIYTISTQYLHSRYPVWAMVPPISGWDEDMCGQNS